MEATFKAIEELTEKIYSVKKEIDKETDNKKIMSLVGKLNEYKNTRNSLEKSLVSQSELREFEEDGSCELDDDGSCLSCGS